MDPRVEKKIYLLILKRKSVVRITTGSQALDDLLGGNVSYLNLFYDYSCHHINLINRNVLNSKEGLKHFASQRHLGSSGTQMFSLLLFLFL